MRRDDRWYLLFSSGPDRFSPSFVERVERQNLGWTTYAMTGPGPFGPFRMHGAGRILPSDFSEQPYACQVVGWKGSDYLMGTIHSRKEADRIMDPVPIRFTPEGIQTARA